MEVRYWLVFICLIFSAYCEHQNGQDNKVQSNEKKTTAVTTPECKPPPGVTVPKYVFYLLAFTMTLMLVVIIYLSIAIKRIKRKTYISNDSRQSFREEANWQSCDSIKIRHKYRNNESTLTINSTSGIVDENRYSEPEIPTRPENNIKVYVTKPAGTEPMITKKQIEDILQHVLGRSKKTASTSLRELNALQNEMNNTPKIEAGREIINENDNVKCDDKSESNNEVNNAQTVENNEKQHDEFNEQTKEVNNVETKAQEIQEKDMNNETNIPKPVLELEVYDTVPTPIRMMFKPDYVDGDPLYECPPTECRNMLMIDPDMEYLMPLNRRGTNTYINARTTRK